MKQWLFLLLLWFTATTIRAEPVSFRYNGIQLNANLEKAENWPKGPVVLMTHGTLAHNRMELISTLQALFAENGVSSLAINLSLGHSNRPSAMYDCTLPHRHLHTDAIREIGAWLEWLRFEGTRKVVLLGHSRGGNQTAWYAVEHHDPEVIGVILVAPPSWPVGKTAETYQKRHGRPLEPLLDRARKLVAEGRGEQHMDKIGFLYCTDTSVTAKAFASYYAPDRRMETPALLAGISVPVLIFTGTEDPVTEGLETALEREATTRPIRVVAIEGADHFFRDLHAEELVDEALTFIREADTGTRPAAR